MELSELPTPVSRAEKQLATLCGMDIGELPIPVARIETFLSYLCEHGISESVSAEEIETIVKEYLEANPDAGHTHDDRYYTESEIDEKLSSMPAGDSGTILFDGDESTSETITLSDDVSNYQYIEIFYGLGASGGGGSQGSIKVLALQNTWTPFGICYGTTTTLVYYAGICALQNNTLLRGDTMRTAMNNTSISERRLVIDHGTSGTLTFTGVVNNISVFYLHIYRVVGYK